MVDHHIAEEILRFKEALARPEDASDSDSSIGAATSNRGRKLKRKARNVHEGRLNLLHGSGTQVVEYVGKRRTVVSLKRPRRATDRSDEDDDYEDSDEQTYGDDVYYGGDAYANIDLEAILSPIGHPSELPTHPGISRAYTRTTLSTLARRALDLICTEQKQLAQINRLLAAFLGDDPSFISDKSLNLPEIYDHDGERSLTEDGTDEDGLANGKSNGESKAKTNGAVDGVKSEAPDSDVDINKRGRANEEEHNNDETEENETTRSTRRVTRNQTTNELDLFFALPKLEVDRNFGFSADTAQDTRQLAQMAAQRGEEFMRSLYQIRSGLLRADRFRAKVYKWCREVGGDVSDDDIDETIQPT